MNNLTKTITLLLITISLNTHSQIHSTGQINIDAKLGINKFNNFQHYELGINYIFDKRLYLNAALNYEYGTIGFTDYKDYRVKANINYTILNHNKLFFNTGVGLHFGNEKLKSNVDNNQKDENIIYGTFGIVEFEYFFNRKFALSTNFTELFTPKSLLGKWQYEINFGVKYILNN